MGAPLEKHLPGRLLHKPGPRPPATTSHDLAPAAPLLSRVCSLRHLLSSQPSSRAQYHTAIHQLSLSQKIRSCRSRCALTWSTRAPGRGRCAEASMSWYCLSGKLELSSANTASAASRAACSPTSRSVPAACGRSIRYSSSDASFFSRANSSSCFLMCVCLE